MLAEDRELKERAAQIEALLEEIQSFPDPAVRAKTAEIVESLLVLYGEGLARMLDIIVDGDEREGDRVLEAFARDELISHLLLLHDLHPVSMETRVQRALDEVRPYLESHGGNVELLGVDGGVVRLRLQGSCSGCPSSTVTLKLAIEEAIQKACPDLERIEAEGLAEGTLPPQGGPVNFLPASDLLKKKSTIPPNGSQAGGRPWKAVDGLTELNGGAMSTLEVSGTPLLFLRLDGTLYAYHNACPDCGRSLEAGTLVGTELACPGCGHHYDVRRAGKGLDAGDRHLQPVPLLVQDGIVKVALSDE